jgi:hypothetical protein
VFNGTPNPGNVSWVWLAGGGTTSVIASFTLQANGSFTGSGPLSGSNVCMFLDLDQRHGHRAEPAVHLRRALPGRVITCSGTRVP